MCQVEPGIDALRDVTGDNGLGMIARAGELLQTSRTKTRVNGSVWLCNIALARQCVPAKIESRYRYDRIGVAWQAGRQARTHAGRQAVCRQCAGREAERHAAGWRYPLTRKAIQERPSALEYLRHRASPHALVAP